MKYFIIYFQVNGRIHIHPWFQIFVLAFFSLSLLILRVFSYRVICSTEFRDLKAVKSSHDSISQRLISFYSVQYSFDFNFRESINTWAYSVNTKQLSFHFSSCLLFQESCVDDKIPSFYFYYLTVIFVSGLLNHCIDFSF